MCFNLIYFFEKNYILTYPRGLAETLVGVVGNCEG